MKKMLVYMCALLAPMAANAQEEIATSSQQLTVNTTVATAVPYSVDDAGEQFPVIWGLDTAWPDEWNMRRGTAFIGAENLGTARASFQPNNLITNGELSASQKAALDKRLNLIRYSGVTSIALNCDHEVLNKANYVGKPAEWVKLIEATARYCQSKGYTIVSVAPFNEPDYSSWGQGSQADMTEVARLLKENPYFQNIRICGANTLNCDQALPWYNAMKQYLDEGNTHQLAGVFNTYATFFETVRADGKHATADELHNVMEAMVGVEYGMQTGIWWGFDGLARGEFSAVPATTATAWPMPRTAPPGQLPQSIVIIKKVRCRLSLAPPSVRPTMPATVLSVATAMSITTAMAPCATSWWRCPAASATSKDRPTPNV